MEEHFEHIKKHYDAFEKFCIGQGILLAKETKDGYWGVTNMNDLHELFKKINLKRFKHLADLGSGDGRVVMLASLHGIKATGFETDDWLTNCALEIKRKLKHPQNKNIQLLHENFLKADLSQHDILFISPDRPFHRDHLGKKITESMHDNAKLIVSGYEFNPNHLEAEQEHLINGERFVMYRKK